MFSDEFSNLKKNDLFHKAKQINPSSSSDNSASTYSSVSNSISPEKSENVSISRKSYNNILVNPNQKGNPLLKCITSVPWEYDGSIIPDYVLGRTSCALFLSLKYHNLHPNYIYERLKQLGKLFDLRVLLIQVDIPNPQVPLNNLTKICLLADLTLMLAWNSEEAGDIIQTYKIYEHKPPDAIMEKRDSDVRSQLINAISAIRSVNRTDAATLLSTFGSLANIINASKDSLSLCTGLGPQKASQLYSTLRQPFLKNADSKSLKKNTLSKYFKKSQDVKKS